MDVDSMRNYHEGPRSDRKRPHEHEQDNKDGRRVKRRSDEHGHRDYMHNRRSRSRSPRRLEQTGYHDHDYDRHRQHSNTRSDTGHGRTGSRRRTPSRSMSRSPGHHRSSHRRHDDDAHHSRRRRRPHHRSHRATKRLVRTIPQLPCDARQLSRSADFDAFRPLFARYLDIQKQIDITLLDEREIRGRWKSFVGKWNNGELAEGWYRPEVFEDVMFDEAGMDDRIEPTEGHGFTDRRSASRDNRRSSSTEKLRDMHTSRHQADDDTRPGMTDAPDRGDEVEEEEDDDDDDDYGPTLPTQDDPRHTTDMTNAVSQTKHGPGIPTLTDLTLRRELNDSERDDARARLRQERRDDRKLQKDRLDELAPRADAGTQARRLEKRREAREANASFAHAKISNDVPEVTDADLLGGGDGIEEHRKLKRETERRKSEREVRREEILRAQREEREVRAREYREREAKTVDMLREIARSRFG